MRKIFNKNSSKALDVHAFILLDDLTEVFAVSELGERFSGLLVKGNEVISKEFSLNDLTARILSLREREQLRAQCFPPPGYVWAD